MQTTMFKGNVPLALTAEERKAVAKFVAALHDGMLYVKCAACHGFKQGTQAQGKNVPHQTDPMVRVRLYYCKECTDG